MFERFRWGATALIVLLASCRGLAAPPEAGFCWQDTGTYRAPNFEAYFPDHVEGARLLAAFWASPDREKRGDLEVVALVREGLRRYEGDRALLLCWLGNRYIGVQGQQLPEAVEIMYHAAECSEPNADRWGTRGAAIKAGLSQVRPMTPAILRALAGISIYSNDPHDLSAIAWGIAAQQEEALAYLKPFEVSTDPAIREKAEVVQRIWRRELKAFDWARERQRQRAEKSFRPVLPEIRERLLRGDSAERSRTLALIAREGITAIMDSGYIEVFAACADDPDPKVRSLVAQLVGERWITTVDPPEEAAVTIEKDLCRDEQHAVRYSAVYYGLSSITVKDDALIRLLLEVAITDPDPRLRERIAWGLRGDKARVRDTLEKWIKGKDTRLAAGARAIYGDMID